MIGNSSSDITKLLDFSSWTELNDTIMGGISSGKCIHTTEGLYLKGNLVEEGGGFVSFRSRTLDPPLNLYEFRGLSLCVDGEGRNLKIAISCDNKFLGFNGLTMPRLKWVFEFSTLLNGTTQVDIPFSKLKPAVRAKKIYIPFNFNSKSISRFQILYSKFGNPGEFNKSFKPGPINILLRSISGLSK